MRRYVIALATLTLALPVNAKEKIFFGNYDDYGGNVSVEVGRGFGYITSKKKFALQEEETFISGYNVVVRWEWRGGKRKTPPTSIKYMVICNDPQVSSEEADEWYGIDLKKPVEKYTSDAFGYDLWFTVCRGDANRY